MVQSYVLHWFQSTSPRWGRRIRITRLRMRFNPRPTRGATRVFSPKSEVTRVSIHAPARGRPVQIMPVPTLMCFNPRPHARGDRTCLEPLDGHPCFNPRPHARGDFGSPLRSCAIKMFQSTPHARGDEAGKPHLTGSLSFNPRPHTRGD